MALVNLILQGKGGVGKSFIATLLAEHYKAHNIETVCVDTDPVNATFTGYAAYGVRRLKIVDGDNIDPEKFDELVEIVAVAPEGSAVIVDNGAATFVPLCASLMEDGIVPFLKEKGHEVKLHTVVAGGAMMKDTLKGLNNLCKNFPDVDVVVWCNEHFGPVKGTNGAGFEDFKVCRENAEQIKASIVLPFKKPETYGRNLRAMHRQQLSFEEAEAAPGFSLLARQRLAMYRREMEEKMERALPAEDARPGKDGAGTVAPPEREAGVAPEKRPARGNGAQAPGQGASPVSALSVTDGATIKLFDGCRGWFPEPQ